MNKSKRKLLIFLWIVLFIGTIVVLSFNEIKEKKLVNIIDNDIQKQGFNGTILIAKDDKILIQKGYGFKDKGKNIKNELKTLYPIASETKSFTAMSILQLEEQGKLSVKERLSDFIPNFPNGDKISLHQLLTHSSGIKEIMDIVKGDEKLTPMEMIQILEKQKLDFTPGEKFHYSNSNYLILAYVVEKVSGMPFHDYVRKNIFEKAEMTNTFFQSEKKSPIAKGYVKMKTPTEYIDSSLNFGYGDIVSNVEDMMKYNLAINNYSLLSKNETEKMQTGYVSESNIYNIKYGYGWEILDGTISFNKKAVEHSGDLPGYNSEFVRYLKDNVVIIILSNDENSVDLFQFGRNIANTVFQNN